MIKEDWVVSPQFSKRWKLAQRFTIGVIGTVCKLFAGEILQKIFYKLKFLFNFF
jgi:hypothetical protein